ncbi:MAG: ATP-binding protein [Candidatus Kryptoniota bacterium]
MSHYILFDELKEIDVKELVKSAREEKISAGETIIHEGEIVSAIYILISGHVEVRKLIDGREETICTLDTGDFFGETAVLGRKEAFKASASVIASENLTMLRFDKETFTSFMRNFPQITWNMAQALSRRLYISNDSLKKQIEVHHQSFEKEITRLNAVIDAAQTVNSSLEIDRVLQLILDEAMRITDAERGTIYLVDEITNEIWSRIIVSGEISEIRQPIGRGISGLVAKTGETVNIQDAHNDPRFNPEFDAKSGFKTKSILCVAIRNRDDKIIGVFQLINKQHGDFDPEDEKFLNAFSIHASIAIENSRLALEMVKDEWLSTVGRMAGTIVHDIKNPLSTIRVYAQILKKKSGNEETSNLVNEMIKEIDRLVNMAQEVLDFSRGASQINIHKTKYGDFITGVLWYLQKDFKERRIELYNENSYNGEVEMDPDKMTRVILNIAGNAADAMPNGGSFYVRSYPEEKLLVIELEDTGTGMPEEIKNRIFEPFITYGKIRGTGLGMVIVKKIIDDHNGAIEISSEIGKGTKMTLKLPISQKNSH